MGFEPPPVFDLPPSALSADPDALAEPDRPTPSFPHDPIVPSHPSMRLNLSKLERVPLREAWGHEARDFTPSFTAEDNLNGIADAFGLSEHELGVTDLLGDDFKSDISCTDGDGNGITANQLELRNHSSIGQILGDVARGWVKKLILVAEAFRPKNALAIQFLNESITENFAFFAVDVELRRFVASPHTLKFDVVVMQNDLVRSGMKQIRLDNPTSAIMRSWAITGACIWSNDGTFLRSAFSNMRFNLIRSLFGYAKVVPNT